MGYRVGGRGGDRLASEDGTVGAKPPGQGGWARVFLKEPENCYFRFWGPSGHDSTLSRQLEGLDRVAVSHKTSLWTLKFEFCVICMCHKILTSSDFFSAIYQCESRS